MTLTKEENEIKFLRKELEKYKTMCCKYNQELTKARITITNLEHGKYKETKQSVLSGDIIIGKPYKETKQSVLSGDIIIGKPFESVNLYKDSNTSLNVDSFDQEEPPDLQELLDNGYTFPDESDISQNQNDIIDKENLYENTSNLDSSNMNDNLIMDFHTWCTENEFQLYKDTCSNSYLVTPLSFDEIRATMTGVRTHWEFLWRLSELIYNSYEWNIYSVSDKENIFCWYKFEQDFLAMANI